jgi:hypothetical protein
MSEPIINEDEMIGFILRKVGGLQYDDVRAVLDAEIEFLQEKGIAEADTAER